MKPKDLCFVIALIAITVILGSVIYGQSEIFRIRLEGLEERTEYQIEYIHERINDWRDYK